MTLTEQTAVPDSALPLQGFRDHLRMASGFADDAADDPLLLELLRAAIAAVEGRTGKVLLAHDFLWSLTAWRGAGRQALPVAPVGAITSVTVVALDGAATAAPPDSWWLERDTHRPHLVAAGAALPTIPLGGRVEVAFTAGFGPGWSDIPADLAQAVYLLAAHWFEHRAEAAFGEGSMPMGVRALVERWRTVRILGGAP